MLERLPEATTTQWATAALTTVSITILGQERAYARSEAFRQTNELPCSVQVSFYVAARCFYNVYLHPIAKYPGPKLAAISNVWYAYQW